MPELPEVEYTARQLRASVIGATIKNAQVFWERTISYPDLPEFLAEVADSRIERVWRRGKFLMFDLDGGLLMTIHRRMTGNLLLLSPGWEIDTSLRETNLAAWHTKGPTFKKTVSNPENHTIATTTKELQEGDPELLYCRVCFNLADGRKLLYTDPRKFGRIELWSRSMVGAPSRPSHEKLGSEPLSDEFTPEQFMQALSRRKSPIKQVLLDQEVVAGLGNIYADEALFYASLHPLRRANSLTLPEIELLQHGIVAVLTLGIEHGGTSFNDYRNLWGEAGENYNHVRVYQKDGFPCERCGAPIERIIVAQRGTHFCPRCQQLIVE